MSFSGSADAFIARAKTVTRRLGWRSVAVGEVLLAVRGGEALGAIVVTGKRRERLDAISAAEVEREGYPGELPSDFLRRYCRAADCSPSTVVTRIAFRHLEPADPEYPAGALGGSDTGPGDLSPEDRPSPAPGPSEALQRPPAGSMGVAR